MGEIRNGRMVFTGNCVQDESEFYTGIFPNLLPKNILIGTWIAFDWQHRFFTGPMIFSRTEMNLDELNEIFLTAEELRYTFNKKKIE